MIIENMFTKITGKEMEVKDEELQTSENLQNESETHKSEILERRWSVITYESVAVSGLTYNEALEWVKKLDAQKISGLCIVTDEAAAKIKNGNS